MDAPRCRGSEVLQAAAAGIGLVHDLVLHMLIMPCSICMSLLFLVLSFPCPDLDEWDSEGDPKEVVASLAHAVTALAHAAVAVACPDADFKGNGRCALDECYISSQTSGG